MKVAAMQRCWPSFAARTYTDENVLARDRRRRREKFVSSTFAERAWETRRDHRFGQTSASQLLVWRP